MLVLKFMFTINCAMCSLQQSFKKSGSAFPTPIMSPLNTISEEVSLLLRSRLLLNNHPITYVSSYRCAFQGGYIVKLSNLCFKFSSCFFKAVILSHYLNLCFILSLCFFKAVMASSPAVPVNIRDTLQKARMHPEKLSLDRSQFKIFQKK